MVQHTTAMVQQHVLQYFADRMNDAPTHQPMAARLLRHARGTSPPQGTGRVDLACSDLGVSVKSLPYSRSSSERVLARPFQFHVPDPVTSIQICDLNSGQRSEKLSLVSYP